MLSAYPAELNAVLGQARFDPEREIVIERRSFYPGRLAGHRVLMAMTGIGPVNAKKMAELALRSFRCNGAPTISSIVFSGVAGSYAFLGDVMVPARWTGDAGRTWTATDPAMLAVARQVAADGVPGLSQDSNVGGDPACLCPIAGVKPVHFTHVPEMIVGGDGGTTDPFNGREFPCFPFGGDVFGCRPCRARGAVPNVPAFVLALVPFIPGFFLDYIQAPEPNGTGAAAADNESAPVAEVAAANRLPFIAFRGVSDGKGDPLMLPGYPVQFFAYQQVAAENAAAATAAFLDRWPAA